MDTPWPAITTRPVRAADAVAATANDTVAGPLPVRPPAIVIQAASLDAVHEHPLIASTRTFTDPPSAPTLALVRSSVNRHGAPSCTTSIRADDMVMAPERPVGVVFGATRYERVASPCPLVALRLTQPAGVSADQEHSRSVLTVT
jgi:hypothetical protein